MVLLVVLFVVYPRGVFWGGGGPATARALLTGTVGVVALAAGLEGHFKRPATKLERLIFIAAAVTLIHPDFYTDLLGAVLLGVAVMLQTVYRPAATASPAGSIE